MHYRNDLALSYYFDSILIFKIFAVIFSLFLITYLNVTDMKNYDKFYLCNNVSRDMFFLTKVIAQWIVVFLVIAVNMILFMIIYIFLTPFELEFDLILKSFTYIYIMTIFYSSVLYVIVNIVDSIFTPMVVFIIFFVYEALISGFARIEDIDSGFKIISYLIPSLFYIKNEFILLYNPMYYMAVISLLTYISLEIYKKKDL